MTFTGSGIVSESIMIVFAVCIGHIFTSFLYIFFMILNNSEKLYAMVLAVLLPRLLMLGKPYINHANNKVDAAVIIILTIILILLGCTYFLGSSMNSLPKEQKSEVPVKAFSLIPLVFIMLILNDVIAPSVLNQMETQLLKRQIEGFYFIGSLLGILAVVFLQRHFSINISYMLNISLALLTIGFIVNLVSLKNYDTGFISAVCFGGSYSVGIINTYYLAGFMTKKFQSIYFYRIGMMLFALYYLFGFTLQNLFKTCSLLSPSAIMAFISICIVLLFFIMSPFFIKTLFLGDWIDDTYRSDVTKCTRLEARLIESKLTPAEIEVCKLLLDGYTLRQISGIQSKAYSTINTYCTSIYRKLDINSRAELLIILQEYKA
jgi:DNA-binding CsgD family transcriptional regulator